MRCGLEVPPHYLRCMPLTIAQSYRLLLMVLLIWKSTHQQTLSSLESMEAFINFIHISVKSPSSPVQKHIVRPLIMAASSLYLLSGKTTTLLSDTNSITDVSWHATNHDCVQCGPSAATNRVGRHFIGVCWRKVHFQYRVTRAVT